MQIACPACSKTLQIADEKLPAGRRVRLTCPSCGERFTFEPQAEKASSTPLSSAGSRGSDFDLTDIGPTPRALICLDDLSYRDVFQNMLLALGYNTIHIPSQQAQALLYLTQVPYEFCALDAAFDGSTLEANPVLACLVELPMNRRRYTFATLCSQDITTGDGMAAYSHSVNLVVNYADIPSCRRIVEQHLAEYRRLYRVYRDMLQQMGRD
jgi:predicted Zn finger-like uncharacterized protein